LVFSATPKILTCLSFPVNVAASNELPTGFGILGLGPITSSVILSSAGGNPDYDPILYQISGLIPDSIYLTILLSRSDDPGNTYPGDITIGEILQGYEDVLNQPHLPVTSVPRGDGGNQHWQVLVDADGIIGPDGKPISVTTQVLGTDNQQQLTTVFDSGFSLPQVPK
jgi:hypothetical protein